jgi:hypothetical protein
VLTRDFATLSLIHELTLCFQIKLSSPISSNQSFFAIFAKKKVDSISNSFYGAYS